MSTKPTVTLDMSGLSCPAPLIGAKKIVDDMDPGQSLLLISDCPGTSDDLFAWARQTRNEVAVKDKMGDDRTAYLITRGSGKATPKPNVSLDMRGTSCPGPILEAKKMLDDMQSGEILLLVSNCPGTPADVDAWVKNTALELVSRVEIARGAFEFYLRKK
ncbi:MAG: sulfurtransferase TusA family protein [Rhodocyclaceae bacterium]|jgi:TusA-related sulfurtransferase|nr:sulfurtransferase TusA family protein [Rhodocyclaceae bacterium]MCO5097158.1 sulfurtransferase TusA family protein [Rhodocyclaceae bacterium]